MSLDQVHLLQKPASNLLNKSLQKVQWKTTKYLVSWLILTSNSILKKYIIIILHLLNLYQIKILIKIMVIMNNGNFICVFECRIVNLDTYRQFTNVAWDWIIQKKKQRKEKTKKKRNQNYIKSGLSQFLFLLYLSFSWLYKDAAFCQCQCHSSCLRMWSIYWRRRQGRSWRDIQISNICNFYSFLWSSSDIFLFCTLHCY